MEGDQTGFSGSPPPPSSLAGVPASREQTGDSNDTPNSITIKNEPPEDPPTVAVGQTLPSMSEENWRSFYTTTTAGHHQAQTLPLVVLNDEGAIYEAAAYKLPPLAKFQKGLVGKLPAIWSVHPAVQNGEGELITGDSPMPQSPPAGSPVEVYKEREDSVIQSVGAEEKGPSAKEVALALLQPVEKSAEESAAAEEEARHAELQANGGSPSEIQIDGAPYQVDEFSPSSYEPLGTGQYSVLTNVVVTVSPPQYGAQTAAASNAVYTLTPSEYYRESTDQYSQAVRQQLAASTYTDSDHVTYVERYIRQQYKPTTPHGLTMDLPSPDSGIGGETTSAVTPRDSLHQIFDYAEISGGAQTLLAPTDEDSSHSRGTPVPSGSPARKNSWNHEYGRNAELDKVQIPKLFSEVGFHYFLESPISTSQRREDDRMTYINKGQYYGITLEYINDPEKTLRNCTVKSTVMLVFREEKSPEDELKAWKFWHSRQHSIKQRILDADTKNSCGIVGQIEEITHNAIAFYWNPMEGPAKISVSVHCLSTDFSNQKGVKGFPLHIQVDTTDDLREGAPPVHRGYCQIKVFCDKGAERKTRDEERRAAKRKLAATDGQTGSRKKLEEMYHLPCERSEFYSMSDLAKPPILFTPDEDAERTNGPELAFYALATTDESSTSISEKQSIDIPMTPPMKKIKLAPPDRELTPISYWDSVLLYVRRHDEDVFHPLHLIPPSLLGLAKALEAKYSITSEMIRHFYKKCKKGITVMMDDDIIRLYCNEDTFIIDVIKTEDNKYDITLEEL